MSYYSELAQNLRRRGCEEDQVLAVLHEVRDTTETAGTTPEAKFGTPEEQAAKFSGKRARSGGQTTLNVFGFLGVCCVVVYAIWPGVFDFTNPVLRNFGGMIALLILLIIGAFVAGFIDTRVPKEFGDSRVDDG
ncbi:hypothetical protein [Brevibacterium spongiae]|uniref:DUF1707 domain-containing protein n=1 Tax=Brevibacterium spongiae TaxID=2909672 RepID=A0ABY5SPD4_9MICO|nr:hypothetical protein [Brevibacterium spongiae]UVI35756.1 hypothetical protein L1F31_16825 [Brevibacterium spongiae]